jgi:Holliday junction resolvase
MSTPYEGGRRFAYYVSRKLASDGYRIIRSAGSKTPVDVVAFKGQPPVMDFGLRLHEMLFVQAKRGDNGTLSPAERAELRDWAASVGALPIVAYQPDGVHVAYRRLTGPGPKDWQPWTPDEVGGS